MSDDNQIERVISKGTFDDKTACGSACDLCVVFPKPLVCLVKFFGRSLLSTYGFICNASWVFFTIGFIMLAPTAYEWERFKIEENYNN
mgnify:CR=1 FL=1